ncbi:MAG: intradiol ring-cleavage dioxygenase [Proteobacteria bacterium]|nr:intradiol ring-cleavage dioxygenase [Pseudomonadota bacterium]
MPCVIDDDDPGLARDVARIAARTLERRRALGWLFSGGIAVLVSSCGGDSGSSSSSGTSTTTTTSSDGTACVADPEETNGPYPADGSNAVDGTTVNVLTQSGIVRSDITRSFGSSTTVAPGVPLTLTLTLENASTSCEMLVGYAIYVWHCDRDGEYSLYASDLLDENYLRGVQVTDGNARVSFITIFPACYSGRYPHIHIEVYPSLAAAVDKSNAVLITQLAMPRDTCTTVYADATGYSGSVANLAAVTTSSDLVFASSTAAQLAAQTPAMTGSVADGYTATATVAIGA